MDTNDAGHRVLPVPAYKATLDTSDSQPSSLSFPHLCCVTVPISSAMLSLTMFEGEAHE